MVGRERVTRSRTGRAPSDKFSTDPIYTNGQAEATPLSDSGSDFDTALHNSKKKKSSSKHSTRARSSRKSNSASDASKPVPNRKPAPGPDKKVIPPKRKLEALEVTTHAQSASVTSLPESTNAQQTRQYKRKQGEGSKEGNLLNTLGSHIDLTAAMRRRDAWGVEIVGIKQSLIKELDYATKVITIGTSLETYAQITHNDDRHIIARDSTAKETVHVEFLKPENLDAISVQMDNGQVHDFQYHGSQSSSLTIHTGITNRTISWAHKVSDTQYLAIGGSPVDSDSTPLFQFQPGVGFIQVWQVRFSAPDRMYRLRTSYSHNFGIVWKVKWCPAKSVRESEIGILAGVFGDGAIRVWVVEEGDELRADACHLQLASPAYTLTVPESECVDLDWLSPTRIAAGCANGMFVVWDLALSGAAPISVGYPHCSFVNNVVSCGPTASDTLLTTSWDCEVKLTNILNPEREFLAANRERMNSYAATWCDFLNSAVVNDDLNGIKMVAIRGGFSASLAYMNGTVTALDSNPKHPFLAVGDASGMVIIVNACRRVFWKKHLQYRRRIYQVDLSLKDGHYRFVENFVVDELVGKKNASRSVVTNIYPKEIMINAVSWNPNAGFEGYLASCTARFVRIDNLTIDD